MFSVNSLVMKYLESWNNIHFDKKVPEMADEVNSKREKIEKLLGASAADERLAIAKASFDDYTASLERLIVARKLESGVTTFLFSFYIIIGNLGGLFLQFLAYITTSGTIGHIILALSMLGSIVGTIFAIVSLKKEKAFVTNLGKGI